MWVQLFIMVASYVIQAALTPKPKAPKAASLGDFDVPTAEQGKPVPVIFGTVIIKAPNVVWYGDLTKAPIRSKSGKK